MLRVFAMLVQSVASTFQMRARRLPVIGTRTMPDALPRMTSDTFKDNHAAQHRSPIPLILSSTQSVRPSKDEGALTTVSHTAPSPSVSLMTSAIHLPLLRRWRQGNEGELPPSVRRTGGVRSGREADELVQWTNSSDERPKRKRRAGSPRLRGETEGALSLHT